MTERDIGRLEAQVKALQSDMTELRADMKAVREVLARRDGGWKTASGIGAFVGGVLVFVLNLALGIVGKH